MVFCMCALQRRNDILDSRSLKNQSGYWIVFLGFFQISLKIWNSSVYCKWFLDLWLYICCFIILVLNCALVSPLIPNRAEEQSVAPVGAKVGVFLDPALTFLSLLIISVCKLMVLMPLNSQICDVLLTVTHTCCRWHLIESMCNLDWLAADMDFRLPVSLIFSSSQRKLETTYSWIRLI